MTGEGEAVSLALDIILVPWSFAQAGLGPTAEKAGREVVESSVWMLTSCSWVLGTAQVPSLSQD